MPVRKHDLTHARHDPAHCLAPGLFRSLKRGERKHGKLDITYQFGEDETMRFVGFEPLGVDDMRLLQGIVATSGPNGCELTSAPLTATGQQLRRLLDPRSEAVAQKGLSVVCESLPKLLTEIGMTDGGDNIRALRASLVRLSNVTVLVTNRSRSTASFHLLAYVFDEVDGRLWVALNPRIAASVIGDSSYARIDMAEVRALQTDPARLLHQRLCGWIDPGKAGRVALETLCEYIWPYEANAEAMKKRRQTARRALAELAAVGWGVDEYAKAKWAIRRPPATSTLP